MKSKIALLAIIAAVVGAFFYFDLGAYLTLEGFKSRQAALSAAVDANPLRAALISSMGLFAAGGLIGLAIGGNSVTVDLPPLSGRFLLLQ